MIKVAITSHWEPWHVGGIERVVANMARYLKNNFEIEIYCTGDKTYERSWRGIPVHIFKCYTKSYGYAPKMRKELEKTAFNIIHAHGFTTYCSYAAARIKKNRLLILNPYYHDSGSTMLYDIMRRIYDPLIGRYILNEVDTLICISKTEKTMLERRFNIKNKRIETIPLGIDADIIKKSQPFDFDKKLILYVGRLEKYKNIHLIIQTLPYLPKEYLLYIIGEGGYKSELIKLIKKLQLVERVKILGKVPDEDVYKWMKTCSVFVTLSDMESFGLTVIEALAAGRPVVVNSKSSLSEFARKFDEAVFEVDANKLSKEKLGKIIIEKSGLKIDVDLSEYTWKNVTNKLAGIYEKEMDLL